MIDTKVFREIPTAFVNDYRSVFIVLAFVGFYTIVRFGLAILHVAAQNHLSIPVNLKKYGAYDGESYAVVTGATDGIGKQFALNLAKRGMNVIIISRTPAKLKSAKADILEAAPNNDVQSFAMDFSTAGKKEYQKLADFLGGFKVSVLVNNVGVSHSMPCPLVEESDEALENIITVNCQSIVKVTKLVLPRMIDMQNGLILNLGSFAGAVPTPYLQTYSGSKAFVKYWSKSLAAEVKDKGVHVEHLNTYFVVSNMSKIRRSSLIVPTPSVYVKNVLKRMGKAVDTTPYSVHNLINFFLKTFVDEDFIVSTSAKMQKATRERALKKLKNSKKE